MTSPEKPIDEVNLDGTDVDQAQKMQPKKSYRKPGFTKLETGSDTLGAKTVLPGEVGTFTGGS